MDEALMDEAHVAAIIGDLHDHQPLAWHRSDRRVSCAAGRLLVDADLAEVYSSHGLGAVRQMLADVGSLIDATARAEPGASWFVARFSVVRDELLEFLAAVEAGESRAVSDSFAAIARNFELP